MRVWLSDQFAFQFVSTAASGLDVSLDAVYRQLYLRVSGSHVSVYNNRNFGNLTNTTLREFFTP
ncbi:MAG: hypothetical protein WCI05_10085 [Myxococcales bacterium]